MFKLFGKKSPAQNQPTANGQPAANTSGGQSSATSDAATTQKPTADLLAQGSLTVRDVVAPSALEVDFNHIKIGNTYFRTLFVAGYPRFVSANWLGPLVNFDHSLNISMFIYPVEGKSILDDLHRKIAEMEAELTSDIQRGKVVNPDTQAKLEDARMLQEVLVKGIERFFQFGLYITIPANSLEELNQVTSQVVSMLGSLLIVAKTTTLQMEDGFKSTLPLGYDYFMVTRNMDTTSLATTFPFTSSELTASEGIMYGINEHNGSLIVFDRFSLENANSVVFAKSGAGKSFMVKLEAFRYLMFGTEIIIIDPENEYQNLCDAVGGEYISFGFNSESRINPFDLSAIYEPGENELSLKILALHSLFKIIMGELSATEEATLDQALVMTYRMRGITPDPATQRKDPPLLEDLYKALMGMEKDDAAILAAKIEKYVKGSFRGIFDQPSNVTMKNRFTVFSVRDLEDALRPVAMYITLDYIWNIIRRKFKRRLLIVDEAWYMMQYPDSAHFLFSMAKRARKYYLGISTITQDVGDFLTTDHGKAIVTNSSIQILLKQSTAAIDRLTDVFYLSQGERHMLLSADVGQGLFFAGPNHVAMQVVASPEEYALISTRPQDIIKNKPKATTGGQTSNKPTTQPLTQTTSDVPSGTTTPSPPPTPPPPANVSNSSDSNSPISPASPPTNLPDSPTSSPNQTAPPGTVTPNPPTPVPSPTTSSNLPSGTAAGYIPPVHTGGYAAPVLGHSASSNRSDQTGQDPQANIHSLSNLELSKLQSRVADPQKQRDPQFKQIIKKVTGTDKPVKGSQAKNLQKILEKEMTSRYHSGAWVEAAPTFIQPSQKELENWSDDKLNRAINQATFDMINQPGSQRMKIEQRRFAYDKQREKRIQKNRWTLPIDRAQ